MFLLHINGGVELKSFSSSIGKQFAIPSESILKKQESPIATDVHIPCSVKHVPSRVANAPRLLFSSAYHGRVFESTILRHTLAPFFTADENRCSGGRTELTNAATRRPAHKDAKELSVAPSEIAMLGFAVEISTEKDGSDASS
jgi:hypothetical protein